MFFLKNLVDWKTEQMFLYRKNEKNVKNLLFFKILAIDSHSYNNSSIYKYGGIYVCKGICLCIIYTLELRVIFSKGRPSSVHFLKIDFLIFVGF